MKVGWFLFSLSLSLSLLFYTPGEIQYQHSARVRERYSLREKSDRQMGHTHTLSLSYFYPGEIQYQHIVRVRGEAFSLCLSLSLSLFL